MKNGVELDHAQFTHLKDHRQRITRFVIRRF